MLSLVEMRFFFANVEIFFLVSGISQKRFRISCGLKRGGGSNVKTTNLFKNISLIIHFTISSYRKVTAIISQEQEPEKSKSKCKKQE